MQVPIHLMAGWCTANFLPRLNARQRLFCMIAACVPDLDGLSILGGQEAFWNWHHKACHNLPFGILVCLGLTLLSRRSLGEFLIYLGQFHLHLVNHIAGNSLERLAAISDGIFGVAMTLLVLDISLEKMGGNIKSEHDLGLGLLALAPSFLTYLMSFLTAGIFWVGQQTQLNFFHRGDRNLTWIHFAFLFSVSLLPLSTKLLAAYIHFRAALIFYWLNMCMLGGVLYASWSYATCAGLLKEGLPAEVHTAIKRRILIAQGLYAIAVALCFLSTFISIGLMVLVQLNYAIAPGARSLRTIAEFDGVTPEA